MRFYFLATTVKENRESTESEFGPNCDFYLKPLRKLKGWGVFRLDESKSRSQSGEQFDPGNRRDGARRPPSRRAFS
jgi:hypothetical protein